MRTIVEKEYQFSRRDLGQLPKHFLITLLLDYPHCIKTFTYEDSMVNEVVVGISELDLKCVLLDCNNLDDYKNDTCGKVVKWCKKNGFELDLEEW